MFIEQLKYHQITIITCGIGCLLFLIRSDRAFVAGYTLSLIFLYLTCIRFRIGKLTLLYCITILIVSILALSFFKDPDSSKGRMLIYKISLSIWRDHFITGIGHNKFEAVYNTYQAEYFRSGINSTKELLLADNTFYAFNDYFQFAIEHGITGIITLIAYFLFISALIQYLIKNNKDELKSIIFFTSQLIAISFAALFTHVYDQPIVQCILISIIIILGLIAYNIKIYRRYALLLLFLVNIAVISINNREQILNSAALKDWEEANQLSEIGAKTASLDFYRKAYLDLHQNHNFLFSYGNTLLELHQFDSALKIYNKTSYLHISNRLLEKIAFCHQSLGNIKEAESFYLRSIFAVPNRFINRYHLFNFYLSTSQLNKALHCGNSILHLPVKIPSDKIDEIREDVSDKLKKISIH